MDRFLDQYLDRIEALETHMEGGFALFGAGRAATEVSRYFKDRKLIPACFIDNDPNKIGKSVDGIPILSKTDPSIEHLRAIIATPRGFPLSWPLAHDIFKGKQFITFDSFYCIENAEKIYRLYNDVFDDEISKNTLKNIVMANIVGDNKYYIDVHMPNQYYGIPEFMESENEYLAEIGAFVGDSLERFIWACPGFKKIYAFEPGKKQYLALETRIRRLKEEWALLDDQITAMNCAVGKTRGIAGIGKSSGNSNFHLRPLTQDEQIEVISIDSYFEDKPISFIKADIEGAEIPMLKGAKKVLADQRPKLAICTYHNVSDLIDIIDLINQVRPYTNMALRHHSYNFTETVLYCWD